MDQKGYDFIFCIVEKDADTGVFVSHCLNYDLMECGPTSDRAWENLKIVVKNHIEYCYTSYQPGLNRRAKEEDVDRFFRLLQENPGALVVDKIELHLKPPSLPEQEMPLRILKVQSGGEILPHVQATERSACVN